MTTFNCSKDSKSTIELTKNAEKHKHVKCVPYKFIKFVTYIGVNKSQGHLKVHLPFQSLGMTTVRCEQYFHHSCH